MLERWGDTFITENPFFKNLQELNYTSISKNSNTYISKKENVSLLIDKAMAQTVLASTFKKMKMNSFEVCEQADR